MFMYAPMVAVRLPNSNIARLTMRGPLTKDGELDEPRLTKEIGEQFMLNGKLEISWLSTEFGVLLSDGKPQLTLRVD